MILVGSLRQITRGWALSCYGYAVSGCTHSWHLFGNKRTRSEYQDVGVVVWASPLNVDVLVNFVATVSLMPCVVEGVVLGSGILYSTMLGDHAVGPVQHWCFQEA
jgi:hypothetical protein